MSTRRKFLFDCSATTLVAVLAPAGIMLNAAASPIGPDISPGLGTAAFAAQLNTPFQIHAGPDQRIQVKLEEVRIQPDRPPKTGKRPPPDAGHEKFTLVFSGSRRDRPRAGRAQ